MQPFILHGFTYTEEEASRAREIRKMEAGEKKDFLIKYFEIESGKKFPTHKPIKISFNDDTAFISSLPNEKNSTGVLNNGRISRTGML